jgi:hypothetical protein
MKAKAVYAIFASSAAGFFLGWLIFGIILAGFYKANTTVYEGLMKDPPQMWGFIIGNLSFGGLFVYIFQRWAGIKTFGKGFVAGMVISVLIFLSFDIFIYGSMNLFTFQVVVVDVLANTLLGGVMAGIAGLVLGMGKE